MLKHLLPLVVIILSLLVSSSEVEPEKLFNGKDLSGWHADVPAADGKPDVPPSFVVRDGLLVSLGKPEGHLITDAEYENYRLTVEYRFPKEAGNCGVLVHASKPRALYDMFPQSIEVQMHSGNAGDFWCIQENIEVPDMEKRRPRKEGQNFGGGPSDARNIKNLTDDSEKPLGEWNTMVIECRGDEIKVWVNDDLVNHGTKCTATKGKIALQAEGTEVEFRKVELEPLGPQHPMNERDPLVLRSGIPIGFLGHPVGTRLTVEGRRAGFNTALQVSSVNGQQLPAPVLVWTNGHILPEGTITLVGYERPIMIGQAPAEVPEGRVSINPHPWSLASQFVVLRGNVHSE